MRLFEAIVDANHRAASGDASAGLHLTDYTDSLPIASLTCIDPRLNLLFPEVLGVTREQFIWLRGVGNIITGPLSSNLHSLALACIVNRAREIAVIGHTDCLAFKQTAATLTDGFKALGIPREKLPDNLGDYFGLCANERLNVMKGVEVVRQSPLISPRIPVHGLIVDVATGRLDWIVNGYEAMDRMNTLASAPVDGRQNPDGAFKNLGDFNIGEMKFPEGKIGEGAAGGQDWFQQSNAPAPAAPTPAPSAQNIPVPPPIPPPIKPMFKLPPFKK
jgi:carbonic anhydrase